MNDKIKCKWCGIDITNIKGIQFAECAQCHDLQVRIEANPAVALKIMQSLREKESANATDIADAHR